MFPGEVASGGDLGENPACETQEETAAQGWVEGTRPQRAWRTQPLLSWAASPEGLHPGSISPMRLIFVLPELLSSGPLLLSLWFRRWPTAWLCVHPPLCLRGPA